MSSSINVRSRDSRLSLRFSDLYGKSQSKQSPSIVPEYRPKTPTINIRRIEIKRRRIEVPQEKKERE